MANNRDGSKVRCSFCGKTQDQVRRMVAGPNAYICNECVLICQEIVSDDVESVGAHGELEIKKPQEIKEVLDQYVVGQEAAKKALSVAVLQPLQAHPLHERQEERRRAAKVQHRHARPDGLRQDLPRPDAGEDPERALRHRRRHEPDRGRLRRRGRRKHPAAADPERRLRRRARPARHHLHRRDRQDRPQEREPRRSRATSAARACSKRC